MLSGLQWPVCAVAALLLSGPAWAGDVEGGDRSFGAPLSAQALDKQRGGEELRLNVMDVKANLGENQAINTLNGQNVITGGAFSNASGLPVAVQNSGNNVIIQNSFILNMNVK